MCYLKDWNLRNLHWTKLFSSLCSKDAIIWIANKNLKHLVNSYLAFNRLKYICEFVSIDKSYGNQHSCKTSCWNKYISREVNKRVHYDEFFTLIWDHLITHGKGRVLPKSYFIWCKAVWLSKPSCMSENWGVIRAFLNL